MDLDRSSPVPMQASTSGSDDWELDPADIVFQEKIAAGAFGDLYKGVYCGQDVAIKILRNVQDDTQQYQEFLQARRARQARGFGAEVLAGRLELVCQAPKPAGELRDAPQWSVVELGRDGTVQAFIRLTLVSVTIIEDQDATCVCSEGRRACACKG